MELFNMNQTFIKLLQKINTSVSLQIKTLTNRQIIKLLISLQYRNFHLHFSFRQNVMTVKFLIFSPEIRHYKHFCKSENSLKSNVLRALSISAEDKLHKAKYVKASSLRKLWSLSENFRDTSQE